MKTQQSEVLARQYIVANGQKSIELIRDGGRFLLAADGQINDARQALTTEQAREWYDAAAYQLGVRP